MSNSFRKIPIHPIAGTNGVAFDKRMRWSRERRIVRDAIRRCETEYLHFPQTRWDEWDCSRDGKQYLHSQFLDSLDPREYYRLIGK